MKPSVSGPLTNGSSELLEPGVKCLLKKSFLSVQNPHPGRDKHNFIHQEHQYIFFSFIFRHCANGLLNKDFMNCN